MKVLGGMHSVLPTIGCAFLAFLELLVDLAGLADLAFLEHLAFLDLGTT